MKPSQYHKRAYKSAKKMNESLKDGGKFLGTTMFKHNPDFPKCFSSFLRARMDRLNEHRG